MKELTLPELPGIGVEVGNLDLLSLALLHGRDDIVEMLRKPLPETPFLSDGCSCWPDSFFKIKGFSVEKVSIYPACFWHDIPYWCGKHGDEMARLRADIRLMEDVAEIHSIDLAEWMFFGVRRGGIEEAKLSFSWGFGWE